MQNEVKNLGFGWFGAMGQRAAAKPSLLWILYFFISIAVVGFIFSYLIALPLCLMGRLWRPLWRLGGRIQAKGVYVLMAVQPWFHAEVRLDLPLPQKGKRGSLTVSNHRSHLDMFILLSYLPNIRALTKRDLLKVPMLNVMVAVLKMILVKRGDTDSFFKSMATAEAAINEGDTVHIFPEMSRCPSGSKGTQSFALLPFRMAKKIGVPIVPLVFIGTDAAWPKEFLGIRFGAPIVVRTLPALDPAAFESAAALRDEAKRCIDQELAKYGT